MNFKKFNWNNMNLKTRITVFKKQFSSSLLPLLYFVFGDFCNHLVFFIMLFHFNIICNYFSLDYSQLFQVNILTTLYNKFSVR